MAPSRHGIPRLGRTIPALPGRDVRRAAVAFDEEHLGFQSPHVTDDFAVIARDHSVIHLGARRARLALARGPRRQPRGMKSR